MTAGGSLMNIWALRKKNVSEDAAKTAKQPPPRYWSQPIPKAIAHQFEPPIIDAIEPVIENKKVESICLNDIFEMSETELRSVAPHLK